MNQRSTSKGALHRGITGMALTSGVCTASQSAAKMALTWTIPGIRSTFLCVDRNITLTSTPFWACERSWNLSMDTCYVENQQNFISLYLCSNPSASDAPVLVRSSIILEAVNPSNTPTPVQLGKRKLNKWFTPGASLGFEKFLARDSITTNDIAVRFSFIACTHVEDKLLFGECAQNAKYLASILRSGGSADTVLVVRDREFAAHSSILSAKSSVFRKVFPTTMKDAKVTAKIITTDADPRVFDIFLSFLYTATFPKDLSTHVEQLYILADKYKVESLKWICSDHLKRLNLDCKIALRTFLFVETLPALSQVQSNIVDHLSDAHNFHQTKEWTDFEKNHPSQALKLLKLVLSKRVEVSGT